jgi:cell division protease FtsH
LSLPEKDDYNHWRKKLLGRIAVCFGGRIAEDLVFGDVSAGAQNDIEQATNLARVMVCELGMSPKVGPIKYTADDENPFLGREFRLAGNVSERTLELIDEEVKRLVDEQYRAASQMLIDNRAKLDAVATALLKHETLSGDEIAAVLRGDDLEEYRQAQTRLQQAPPKRIETASALPGVPPLPVDKKPDVGLSGA